MSDNQENHYDNPYYHIEENFPLQEGDELRWYAVYCKSRHEKKVVDQLYEKKINHYLPVRKEMRQWSDRKKEVELPLFRGYMFVNIPKRLKIPVLETYGIVTFVTFANKLESIPDEQIEAVRVLESYGEGLQQENVDFELEDRVRVTGGPCKDLVGHLAHHQGKNRFVVVIDTLKMGASVIIEKHWLEKIPKDEPQ